MHTIRIKVNDAIYEKLMGLLSKFNKDEIEILSEDQVFLKDQKYLQDELDQIENGDAKFIPIEEAEKQLNKVIAKHENNI